MGTERQGITKNVVMQRIDSHGRAIEVKYAGDGVHPRSAPITESLLPLAAHPSACVALPHKQAE